MTSLGLLEFVAASTAGVLILSGLTAAAACVVDRITAAALEGDRR